MTSARALAGNLCSLFGRLAMRLPLIVLAAACLVCIAPGFDSDEAMVDPRLSAASIARLRDARARERDPIRMSIGYMSGVLNGELGNSTTLGAPVAAIARQRWPVTARELIIGAGSGWLVAMAAAVLAAAFRMRAVHWGSAVLSAALICVPSALIGLTVSVLNGSVALALVGIVFARVYQYLQRILKEACAAPHVRAAEAAGLPPARAFVFAALPNALPQVIATAGLAINISLAAIVPLEVVCDSPGLAELAWKSALGRDVPVLLFVTLALSAAFTVANALVDGAVDSLKRRQA